MMPRKTPASRRMWLHSVTLPWPMQEYEWQHVQRGVRDSHLTHPVQCCLDARSDRVVQHRVPLVTSKQLHDGTQDKLLHPTYHSMLQGEEWKGRGALLLMVPHTLGVPTL